MKFALSLLLVTLATATAAEAEAIETHKCACEAVEFGFDIDCNNTAAMLNALTFLKASTCATDCTSTDCEKNWLIMQVHHDYCPEERLPEEIEDAFHDYDMTCKHCDIVKTFIEGAPDCPVPVCTDSSGNDAYVSLVEGGCLTDCSSDTCRDYFFLLRAVHDGCEEGALTTDTEKGLHDLEAACAAQNCNAPAGLEDPLVCDEDLRKWICCCALMYYLYIVLSHTHFDITFSFFPTDEDHGDEPMPAGPTAASGASKASTTGVAALFVGALMIA